MDDVESHSIKDIQNLLENADQTQGASWRKYARLVLPHVGLVTVVCVYAMVGAWVFYAIESPHEDRLKIKGVQRIQQMRRDLTELVWERHDKELGQLTRDEWISKVRQNLQLFNENLYRAYKDQYVRYGDVRLSKREPLGHDPRIKRHRSSKSRSEKGGKLWTASSSLFFAATTMATIGYGNIVPVTNYGRIACIVFALFGAPLAIITIGDLGKFLSECTIWLYRRIKEKSRILRYHLKNWSWRKQGVITEVDQMSLSRNSGGIGTQSNMDMSEWDDLEKAEVPVLLVFAILLLYIAFGGVLFAILESWTYMDAFYYCFVSLTTIGFGDLVPDRHEYIVLMLIYLGVGLAVTTMCIDLVGIQYIQKIHYFGRKFKGTDILQILRRKRMLERRFAMGEGKEFIEYVIQVTQETRGFHPPSSRSIMPPVKIASQFYSRDDEEEKLSLQSEKEAIMPWSLDDINVDTTPLTQLPLAQKAPTPEVISAKSLSPLPPPLSSRSMTPLTNSTDSARSLMYEKWTARNRSQRDNSWAESGPDVSVRCSISTTPSVQEREFIYNNFRSPAPSVMSFQFSFPLPSPDLRIIAEASRNARRVTSCPSIIKHTSTPAQTPTPVSSITSSPIGLSCMEEWESYTRMLDEYLKPVKRAPTPVAIEKLRKCSAELAYLDFVVENPPEPQPMTPPPPEPEPPRPSAMTIAMGAIAMATTSFSKVMAYPDPPKPPSPPPLLPIIGSVDWEIDLHSATPILDSHSATVVNLELTPAAFDPCHSPRVVNVAHTARSEISLPCYRHSISGELEPGSEELQEIPIFGHVAQKAQISDTVGSGYDMSEAKMHKTASPPLLVTLQREDMEKEKIDFEDAVSSIVSSSSSEIEEEEESGSKSSEPVFDIDLGAFELVDSGVTAEALLSQEEPVIYHKDMPVHSVHHDTVQTEAAIENLMNAPPSMLSSVVPPTMVADNYCFVVDGDKINMGDILGDEQWWRHTSRPTKYFYSEDMKRFYRVTCLSARGKVIAARLANTVPAMGGNGHGQHQTEPPDSPTKRRLRSLSSTRDSIVSGHSASPRIINAQSGAFGSSPAGLSGASRGQQGQQQTAGGSGSYPGTAFQSYATTPRSSMAYQHGPLRCEVGQRGERVDLTNVYKVVRFYSFWKTCTSFHRIVTMIEKVAPAEENESKEEEESEDDRDLREVCTPTLNFHKRLFVQYLWRNAKPMEKARVQKEFDPRRQRLLRFVTDTAARKRMTGAISKWHKDQNVPDEFLERPGSSRRH